MALVVVVLNASDVAGETTERLFARLAQANSEEREAIERRIVGRGAAAVPVLAAGLRDADALNRARAARLLGLIGSEAGAALTVLGKLAAQDENEAVRVEAVRALTRLGDAALPALVEAIRKGDAKLVHALDRDEATASWIRALDTVVRKASDHRLRVIVLKSLAKRLPADSRVLATLTYALGVPDERLRLAAAWGLTRVAEVDAVLQAALVRGLRDDSPVVRAHCAIALQGAGDGATATLDDMVRSVDEPEIARTAAATTLALRGRWDVHVVDTLLRALARTGIAPPYDAPPPSAGSSGAAAIDVQAVRILVSGGERVVPSLAKQLDAKARAARLRAVFALGHCGRPAIPHLKKLLSDNDIEIGKAAALCLCLYETDPATYPLIIAALLEPATFHEAEETVLRIGAPIVPALFEAYERQIREANPDGLDTGIIEWPYSPIPDVILDIGTPALELLRRRAFDRKLPASIRARYQRLLDKAG